MAISYERGTPLAPGKAYTVALTSFAFQCSGFGFRVLGFGFQNSGFVFQVSGFWFRVSGFGFRFSVFGVGVSLFGVRGCSFGMEGKHLYEPRIPVHAQPFNPHPLLSRIRHMQDSQGQILALTFR